ncbi:hypothetical protein TRFO_36478 [Tritrichomonas foetus]|uniref:DH domain-containing protein n=1 Tax=Tritrichomonas foetus TaxID=1144522 RepID=A0A1J4JGA0_9EUKA|nr:hypothetical protein TRFO_36478 [Tritrichomonas foetus]|eukprot:OHS97327.1 hypothetical protein TRFO_36478 [Tritrichomonas foetus]
MATNLTTFVIILSDNEPPLYKEFSLIEGKIAKAVKISLGVKKGYTLAIRTPTFIQYIDSSLALTDVCPDLLRTDKYDYSYAIKIINKTMKDSIQLIFETETENKIDLPRFIVKFSYDELLENQSSMYIFNKVVTEFELPIENPQILINFERMNINCNSIDLINFMKNSCNRIIFRCRLTLNAINMINKRMNPIKELIESEKTYIERLIFLTNFFPSRLFEFNLMTPDLEKFFKCSRNILHFHTMFYNSLYKHDSKSNSIISQSFFEMGNGFLINQEYVRLFHSIQPYLSKIKENEQLHQIEQRVFSDQKLTFESYVSAPFQRPLKYPNILKEIINGTPKSHIDFKPLCCTLKMMILMCSQLDSYCDDIENKIMMINIANRISLIPELIAQGRILLQTYKIQIQGKYKKRKGRLYIFNDRLLLTSINNFLAKFKEKPLFFNKIKKQSFLISCDMTMTSVVFSFDQQTNKLIYFKSKEAKESFITELSKARKNLFKPHRIHVEEIIPSCYNNIPPPGMFDLSAASLGQMIYFSGGLIHSENDKNSPLITFDAKNNSCYFYKSIVTPDVNMKMTIAMVPRDEKKMIPSIYLIGGREKNNVMHFDQMKWEKCPGDQFSRTYHSMITFGDYLVVFGGINENKEASDDIVSYNYIKHSWNTAFIKFKKPSPRYNHSAVVYKNVMIIYGGMYNNQKLHDTWVFSFTQGEWAKIDLGKNNSLFPRSGHTAVMVNQFMVVFGGEGYDNMPFAVNIDTWEVIDLKIEGNYFLGMNRFAAALYQDMNEKKIICFGGFNHDNSVLINSFTSLTLPEEIIYPIEAPSKEEIIIEKGKNQCKLVRTSSKKINLKNESLYTLVEPLSENNFKRPSIKCSSLPVIINQKTE